MAGMSTYSYYIKVDGKYYAEHADGTAYLAKDAKSRRVFTNERIAKLVASELAGAKVKTITDDGWRPVK